MINTFIIIWICYLLVLQIGPGIVVSGTTKDREAEPGLHADKSTSAKIQKQAWWQKTTIYQIYPRSYMDSNDDGIGDLRGIITKLDYIQDLGFETIWLSPFFSNPQADWGYDISDYYNIAPEYGDQADVEALIYEVHKSGVPVTYYGEEIGMADGNFPAKTVLDPMGRRFSWIPDFLVSWLDLYVNRDGCRTPMQWDNSNNARFCGKAAAPWLPVHPNYQSTNVKQQLDDANSLLNVYRGLLRLRRKSAAIIHELHELMHEFHELLIILF